MELQELVGDHLLDAVDFSNEQVESWGGQFEDCQVVRFRLDGVCYTAIEDPDDGYRSSMKDLFVETDAAMMNVFPPLRVIGRYQAGGEYGEEDDVLELIDAVTTQCRWLILDTQRERVVANPFPKFYNWGDPMVGEIPLEEPIITEKVDGSLGILYWIDDDPHIATRGSFTSEQALWATKWFRQHVAYQSLPRHITYLMEIVYSENRIVVAYPYEGCVLLAARETATGVDYATIPSQHLFPLRAEQIPATDLESLAAMDEPNSEGFVLHWPRHGQRVKIKFPTYCALHRVITGLSVRVIYGHLASGQPLSALLDVAPDEMYPWIQEKAETLQCEYDRIEAHARIVVKEAQRRDKYPTRKDQAALITSLAYPGVCFSLLDGKDPAPSIWKLLRPAGSDTYRQEAADA